MAERLLAAGRRVITLTGSPAWANPFGDRVPAFPFRFDRPDLMAESLRGVRVLHNTYWVRFNHRTFTREEIRGLMEGRLCVEAPPAGTTKLTAWARRHAAELGRVYHRELRRRIDRTRAY